MSDNSNICVIVVLESIYGFFSLNFKSLFFALLLLRVGGENPDSSCPPVTPVQQEGKGYHIAPEWGVDVQSPV